MTHKILVVDDDDALREMVGLVLSSNGYQPVFASDGISAVEVFKQSSPDLVLLVLTTGFMFITMPIALGSLVTRSWCTVSCVDCCIARAHTCSRLLRLCCRCSITLWL